MLVILYFMVNTNLYIQRILLVGFFLNLKLHGLSKDDPNPSCMWIAAIENYCSPIITRLKHMTSKQINSIIELLILELLPCGNFLLSSLYLVAFSQNWQVDHASFCSLFFHTLKGFHETFLIFLRNK